MSWPLCAGGTLLFVIFCVSLWLRMANIRYRQWFTRDLPQEPIPSLFSKALAQLLGVAGGIYLVLVMAVSFLKIEIPAEIHLFGLAVEPLAFVAVVLALVQPFVERLWLGQN